MFLTRARWHLRLHPLVFTDLRQIFVAVRLDVNFKMKSD